MLLLSQKYQISKVYRHWTAQYPRGRDEAKDRIGDKLANLDPNKATKQDVRDIIGNYSWCQEQACHECKNKSWDVVNLGEDAGYESSNANICLDCLRAAAKLIESQ